MKTSDFRRWLVARGAVLIEAKRHTKIYLNGRQTLLPRHPSKEIGEGLRKAILKQLRLS